MKVPFALTILGLLVPMAMAPAQPAFAQRDNSDITPMADARAPSLGRNNASDVNAFIHFADTCEHLAGEWDDTKPPAELKVLESSINKYCSLANHLFHVLSAKYKNDPSVTEVLRRHSGIQEFRQ